MGRHKLHSQFEMGLPDPIMFAPRLPVALLLTPDPRTALRQERVLDLAVLLQLLGLWQGPVREALEAGLLTLVALGPLGLPVTA